MAIPYQPPGVLTVNQQQSAPLNPQLATGQEIPSLIGYAAPGIAGYPTQLDTFAATAYPSVLTLSKTGVEFMGLATAVPEAALVVYNPTTYQTINYGNYNVFTTATADIYGNTINVSTVGFVNYPGTVAVSQFGGTVIAAAQYQYAVSYLVVQGTANGVPQVYETGIGTTSLVNAASNMAYMQISNVPVGSQTGFNVVGRNVYRQRNLGSSAAPYWGPWYQVFSYGAGSAVSGYSGYVTLANNSDTNIYDGNPEANINTNNNPVPGITAGDTLQVSYQYADSTYYLPTLFTEYPHIESKYGPAFDTSGNVLSQLSFGAKLAMLNGANEVVCTAVAASDGIWSNAFANLLNDDDSTIIVPLTGNESIHAAAAAHCTAAQKYNIFRTAIVGADGVNGTVTISGLKAAAASYNRKDIQYV